MELSCLRMPELLCFCKILGRGVAATPEEEKMWQQRGAM